MAFSICHKTILPQQIHSAVHIIIMHLNANTVWRDMQCQMCVAEYLHTTGERHCSQKTTYMLIYYTLKMPPYAFILPLILLCFSPAFPMRSLMWEAALGTQPCHINMRTGETLPLLSPVLQSLRPAAVEAATNDIRYGRSCQLVVSYQRLAS